MRFLTTAVALLSATIAPASAFSLISQSGAGLVATEKQKIPGDSPLALCDRSHADDVVVIERVDLVPNPPKAGQDLIIKASGIVKEDIYQGAYVLLTVKYGLIRLLTTKADLCEQIQNVDLECPIKAGRLSLTKNVTLPAEIPPGKYTVFADVYTVDKEPVTCLTATVSFSPNMLGAEL
ncbi:Phosphatidylglycerol/phosphatidylinositol transfer protein [Ceratocystis pirilliformis]|uniref:Phosphatidylglycerol/phosphatidylinositol transfer protein n=1 Tax=Ceratocystis pirilliformis TaxID=259994 RepID=A0ABR3YU63_9PEZI